MAVHVALGIVTFMLGIRRRTEKFVEHRRPIPDRLAVYFYNRMFDDGRADSLVSEREMNGTIARIEFEDWPHLRAHLLALHVSSVAGNAQRAEADEHRNPCLVSDGAARRLVLRHGGK